jgi:hypothetical protein
MRVWRFLPARESVTDKLFDGTKPSKPLESTTGFTRVATASVFSRRGPFLWTPGAHDELKGEFITATKTRGTARGADGTATCDEMDCLTEQSQFLLKTKDFSRNKPKQSQITSPILSGNLLIPERIDQF